MNTFRRIALDAISQVITSQVMCVNQLILAGASLLIRHRLVLSTNQPLHADFSSCREGVRHLTHFSHSDWP